MINQLLSGGLVSLVNFGIHAVMTGIIVIVTRHVAGRTDDLHVFMRLSALMMVTVVTLMLAHVVEIGVWASYYAWAGIETAKAGSFEYYTALGYGDAVAGPDFRLMGPITALNGLLLIGWSVAIIFEIVKMADVQIGRDKRSG
jgi:Ion channel